MMPQAPLDSTPHTLAQWHAWGAMQLSGMDARREAEILLGHALQRGRAFLFAHANDVLEPSIAHTFAELIQRRQHGEPIAYLTGTRGFWTLELHVTPATLIPRPETEVLVEAALARLPEHTALRIADLGTGSGAIALALASERPHAHLTATDQSPHALQIARENAARLELSNLRFLQGDWFAPLAGERFHLIASNPPYIAERDPHLSQGDLRFEPATALASGVDGLDAIRLLIASAPAYLHENGWLLLEHGHDQGQAVRELLCAAGFTEIETRVDAEDRERVSMGKLQPAHEGLDPQHALPDAYPMCAIAQGTRSPHITIETTPANPSP